MIYRYTSLLLALFAVATSAVSRAQSGTGLAGVYHDTASFTSPVTTRTDSTIDFDWGSTLPSGTALTSADTFSVIWTGQIEAEFSEAYVFHVTADDSATLWVNDQVVCHRSFAQAGDPPITGQIRLEAGRRVNLRLEYVEQTGNAKVRLEWSSASRPREVIPTVRLYPNRVPKAGGALLKENWTGLPGTSLATLTGNASFPNRPAAREFITRFECLARDWADGYGARVTGFIVPPITGTYTFAASGDDTVELWLSTDESPANRVRIATVAAPTAFRQWDADPATQQSAPIALVQGRRYSVELLHKEGTGNDHWSVGWRKPGDGAFSVVPGDCLVQAGLDRPQPAQANLLDTAATGHPRLYASDESFARLRAIWNGGAPATAKTWADSLIAQADAILPTAPVTYPLNVDSARVVMNNMYRLGLAWQLTQDPKYPERAYTELAAVAGFADWFDGRTLLATSETTHGFAIAYDWMYAYWSQTRRDTIRNAITTKGLTVALSLYKSNFWALRTNAGSANWNIVCNAGIATGALAVGTESETLCEDILARALKSLRPNLVRFTTDQGGIHEGPNYLEYAQRYAVRGMAGLEWVLGADFGLSATQGISETAMFPIYTAGPSNVTFSASDDAESSPRRGWLWPWSARRFNQPFHNSWNAANASPTALDLLWFAEGGQTPATAGAQPDLAFKGESGTPFKSQEYVALRGSWRDSRTTFVAAKAGEILTSHGHYDVGTFALDALGRRWFRDLGKELYSIGVPGTDLYRYRAEGHNSLVIDPGSSAGNVNPSFSPLVAFQARAGGAGAFALYNLTPAYGGTTRVWRGFRLLNNRREVLLQDEIQATTGRTVWWFAHYAHPSTTATVSPDGSSALLTQGTDRLWCRIVGGGGTFQILDAAPLPTSPNPAAQSLNSGHRKLAIQLGNVTNATLAVWFVPLEPGESVPSGLPEITPLATWLLDDANYPPVAGSTTVTSVDDQAVDVDLSMLAEDDNTPAAALLFSVLGPVAGTVALLPDGRTARFTPSPGASGQAGFSFTVTDSGGLTSNAGTITVGGAPRTHTWSALVGGNWSTPANWMAASPPSSYRGSDVRVLTGQALPNGASVTITNDLPGTTQLNSLSLNGGLASGGTATVNLSGNPLQLVANGLMPPSLALSGPTSGFTYNVIAPIELTADTTFNGANTGRVNFSGVLSGAGGFTRTGSYTALYFGADNTYAGPTVIGTGGLFVGLSGSTSTTGSLGLGEVITSGPLTFQRSNAYTVSNRISGTGSVIHSGAGTLTLSPENAYSGSTLLYRGTLVAASFNSVNGGTPLLPSSSLGAPSTAAAGIIGLGSSSASSVTLRYVGAGETTDRVLNLRSTSNATLEHAGTGLLRFTGGVTATGSGTKTLTLAGSTAGVGEMAGAIADNSSSNRTNVAKSGSGIWILSGGGAYTGTTSVNAGTLVVNGSVVSPATFTIGSSGRVEGTGTIASPLTVSGAVSPGHPFGALVSTGSASFGSSGRLAWELGGNSLTLADRLDASTVSVTSGARVDVSLNSAASTTNFLHSFWRTARVFPVVSAASMTGAFTLGTVSTDSGGRAASTYGSFSLQNSPTGATLLWTPTPGFPSIDDPTVTLVSPAQSTVSVVDASLSLRLSVTFTGGDGTTVAWTQTGGDGTASFDDHSATDTRVTFPTSGIYTLRCTVANQVGSAAVDLEVHVAQETTLLLREGINEYAQPCTFIRGDGPTWNSGARDQVIVGRSSAPFRALLAFDIPALRPGYTLDAATLELWVSQNGTGTGALGALELRRLAGTFLEGTGNGVTASNGAGSGADWNTRTGDPADPWTVAGLGSGGDFEPEALATSGAEIPANLPIGARVSLSGGSAMRDALLAAAGSSEPLAVLLTSTGDGALANHFIRLASNDHPTIEWRPLLTLVTSNRPAPAIELVAPASAAIGEAVALIGSVTNAASSQWTLVSGPGNVEFGSPSAPASGVTFSSPGIHVLRLSASNIHGETSRTVTVRILTRLERWRQTHFSTAEDAGDASDTLDPDGDGLPNLLEFACGTHPLIADPAPATLALDNGLLELTYRRSHAAMAHGIQFSAQWSDSLTGTWSETGILHTEVPGTDNGTGILWKASLPIGAATTRFLRLQPTAP